jgi:hypothetical protein
VRHGTVIHQLKALAAGEYKLEVVGVGTQTLSVSPSDTRR